tara:strand:+ start:484 stop:1122 length:639 start_codon:yes stop_codon:yes gene_type:complete
MSGKYLLREYFELCEGGYCKDLLTEEEKRLIKEENALFLTGIMQKADTENGNGRIYGNKILSREIKNYKKIVSDKRALGELDHPESSVVNLQNVSHLVTDIWMENNSVMGKIKVLDTPSGKILRSLVDSGVKVGISSRGLGSVKKEGERDIVEDDFQLICFDIVSDPSTPGAFMNPDNGEIAIGLSENKVPVEKIFSKTDRLNRILNDILDA